MTRAQLKLPVLVADEDIQNYPKFAQLLDILPTMISEDGTSIHLQKEAEQAEVNLSQARYNWLMSHIPYYELHELLNDFEIRGVDGMLSAEEEQFKDYLSQTLAANEVEDYLSIYSNPTSGSTLFGLSQADVDQHNPVRHLLPAIQQAALPMLEERFRKKCEELYDFFATPAQSETVSDQLLLVKSLTLPQLVEVKQQQLSKDNALLRGTKAKKNEHFVLYYQKLIECLSLMESIIKGYKFEYQLETDRTEVKSLAAQSTAIVFKARKTHFQVLCDAYSGDNVKALRVIENHLQKEIQKTESEIASVQQALNAYHTMGSDFKSLADEYTHLKSEIENCKWGLQRFLNFKQ